MEGGEGRGGGGGHTQASPRPHHQGSRAQHIITIIVIFSPPEMTRHSLEAVEGKLYKTRR